MRFILGISLFFVGWIQAQDLPSIAKMPDLPSGYFLRDWKKTARDFDRLVFDETVQASFFP